MGSLTKFVVAGLLVNLVSSNVFAESMDTCMMYRVETNKNIMLSGQMGHKGPHNQMKINFDVLLKSHNHMKNMISMHIREPEVFVDREKHQHRIDINRCPSNIVPARLCQLPTLMVFDNDGLLKEIKVDKDEPEVCINIKLYLAGLMQINRMHLKETMHSEKSNRDELNYIGTCPVSYEVHRDHDKKENHWRITKNVQLDHCSGVNNSRKHGDLHASAVLDMEVSEHKEMLIPQLVLYNATFDYHCGGHPGTMTHVEVDAIISAKNTISCTAVPSFVDANTMTVTAQHLRPIDEHLLTIWKPENGDLLEIYRALASEGMAMNIYQDLYEKILKCWEMM